MIACILNSAASWIGAADDDADEDGEIDSAAAALEAYVLSNCGSAVDGLDLAVLNRAVHAGLKMAGSRIARDEE